MFDHRLESIIYQAEIYYLDLLDELEEKKKLGKALNSKWEKEREVLSYLKALNYRDRLQDEADITNIQFILERLIYLCQLSQFPTASPLAFQEAPNVIAGVPGADGQDGAIGPQGETGMATDFQVSLVTVPTVLDSFAIADAKGARWDYTVIKSTGEQRSGSVVGTWLDDGSELGLDLGFSTPDIGGGDTDDLEFDLQYNAGDIELIAVPAAGQWQIIGTRYFIPNNGNGSGPVGDVLANGQIYIGNASNVATANAVTGVIAITNTGITSFTAEAIVNSDINATAAIAVSKLAALTATSVVASDASGFLTALDTATYPSLTELSYVKGASASLQTQITAKLTDPMTTIGDIVIRDGTNTTARLEIGTANQVLTVSGGVPAWAAVPGGISGLTTGTIPKAASATTLSNSLISESGSAININGTLEVFSGIRTQTSGPYLKTKVINIGDWNMDTTGTKTVSHGLTLANIRTVSVIIRDDLATSFKPFPSPSTDLEAIDSAIFSVDATNVTLSRRDGGQFDDTPYDSTSYNRGWVTIEYEA